MQLLCLSHNLWSLLQSSSNYCLGTLPVGELPMIHLWENSSILHEGFAVERDLVPFSPTPNKKFHFESRISTSCCSWCFTISIRIAEKWWDVWLLKKVVQNVHILPWGHLTSLGPWHEAYPWTMAALGTNHGYGRDTNFSPNAAAGTEIFTLKDEVSVENNVTHFKVFRYHSMILLSNEQYLMAFLNGVLFSWY